MNCSDHISFHLAEAPRWAPVIIKITGTIKKKGTLFLKIIKTKKENLLKKLYVHFDTEM